MNPIQIRPRELNVGPLLHRDVMLETLVHGSSASLLGEHRYEDEAPYAGQLRGGDRLGQPVAVDRFRHRVIVGAARTGREEDDVAARHPLG